MTIVVESTVILNTLLNVVAISLMGIVLYSNSMTQKQNRMDSGLLNAVAISCALVSAIDIVSIWLDGRRFAGIHVLQVVVGSALFMCTVTCAALWAIYVDNHLHDSVDCAPRRVLLLALPVPVCAVLSVVNVLNGCLFSFDANNTYQRGPLAMVSFALSFYYLTYTLLICLADQQKKRSFLFFPIYGMIFFAYAGGMLQFQCYGVDAGFVGVAIGLVACYMGMQKDYIYMDSQTGLYNRLYFGFFLEQLAEETAQHYGGIMMDIDLFKQINDRFGHVVGDDAIRDTGYILRRAIPPGAAAIRYGGDEFVVMFKTDDDSSVHEVMESIRDTLADFNESAERPYQLSFSLGYSIYDPSVDSVEDFLQRIDKRMYEEKARKGNRRASDRAGAPVFNRRASDRMEEPASDRRASDRMEEPVFNRRASDRAEEPAFDRRASDRAAASEDFDRHIEERLARIHNEEES